MQLKIHPVRLTLKQPFRIAHGIYHHREAIIIELRDGKYTGLGEATVITYYGKSLEGFIQILEKNRSLIETHSFSTPKQFWNFIYPLFKIEPFILCALDVAAHDLWAKQQGKTLYKAWNLSIQHNPLSNFTISIDSIPKMLEQMTANPNPIYKIKLGTKEDIEIISALRAKSNAIFRVDANCAWNVDQTIKNAIELKKLGVEFIEQPLPQEDMDGMKHVYQYSVLPIIADESCQTKEDVLKCKDHFHGINIKLMKCGGFTPALQMIKEARALQMKVMCGCMTESSIGISAIAQLLPLLDYVDMDGALLIKNNPAIGVVINEGKVTYGTGNGLGARLL